jgi:hypothetical protein
MTPSIINASGNAGGPAPQTWPRLGIAAVWCAVAACCAVAAARFAPHGAPGAGEAVAALHHLLSSGTLYRMGFAIDVIALACLLP